jgi:hypothetical protein
VYANYGTIRASPKVGHLGEIEMDSTTETARMTKFYRGEYAHIIGRTIVDIRAMYPEEMELFMWDSEPGSVILLNDGGMVIPMSDSEGNGVGYLMIEKGGN